jgi:signal transduction histidine kinase
MSAEAAAQDPRRNPFIRLGSVNPHLIDALLALLFTVIGVLVLLSERGDPTAKGLTTLGIALTLLMTVPLALLRLSPLTAMFLIGGASVTWALAGYGGPTMGAATAAVGLFVVAANFDYVRAFAVNFVAVAVLVVVFIANRDLYPLTTRLLSTVSIWVVFTVLWIFGTVIKEYRLNAARERERAALFAADRDARAQEAVSLERARLARELHDTVGHALNVVVIQAGAAQRVFGKKPHMALEAISAIESAGRQAMTDMERMLGILRTEARDADAFSAQPGLAQLDRLLEQVREVGLRVDTTVTGRPAELPSSIDLSAYRIVQEALTNTLKHAGPRARARVAVRYGESELELEIVDDGGRRAPAAAPPPVVPPAASPADASTAAAADAVASSHGVAPADDPSAPALGSWIGGRGLVGMRERVALFGGVLEVGPRAEGGYRVFARLPLAPE